MRQADLAVRNKDGQVAFMNERGMRLKKCSDVPKSKGLNGKTGSVNAARMAIVKA